MSSGHSLSISPVRRSREGAWIEIIREVVIPNYLYVAPARERGLKSTGERYSAGNATSLPRGSVD